jgi:sugar/nucleoside kinase (ribokinase family)
MTPDSPIAALDLLVVGGLTIDRFPDGSSVPGGSVHHIARAAAPRGVRVGLVTSAGPEPEAQTGLAELRRLAASVEVNPSPRTTTFRHAEAATGRRLSLERVGGRVASATDAPGWPSAKATLYAPVAGEIGPDVVAVASDARIRGAILQGWLRSHEEGAEVSALSLAAMERPLLAAVRQLDLLVASREDLRAVAESPSEQLTALREAIGQMPALIVTEGADGLWLDHADRRVHLPVPRRGEATSSVGAGDILAAFLLVADGEARPDWAARAHKAMRVVADVLEERSRHD